MTLRLRELFPDLPFNSLEAALEETGGDVELAAIALLEGGVGTKKTAHASRLQTKTGKPTKLKGSGWHSVTDEKRGSRGLQSPHFIASSGQRKGEACLTSSSFPALDTAAPARPLADPLRSPQPSSQASPLQSPWRTPPRQASPGSSRNRLASLQQDADRRLANDLQRRLDLEAERPFYALVAGSEEASDSELRHRKTDDSSLASLCQRFQWAGVDVIREALVAAGGSKELAVMLLAGLSTPLASPAASPSRQRRSRQPARSNASQALLSDEDLERAELEEVGRATPATSKRGSARRGRPSVKGPRRASAESGLAADPGGASPEKRLSPPSPDTSDDELDTSLQNVPDVYRRFRASAVRLDRRRFRRLKQAAHLYAVGDHFQAKLAVQEAKAIKRESDAAHAVAAADIERENNLGKGVWELDLHGLHIGEANLALDKRLKLLESQCLAHGDKRTLRVIVGRGSHSSGGEAILHRSAQNHLLQGGYAVEHRGGVLIVHPKHRL